MLWKGAVGFLSAFAITCLLIPALIPIANRFGLVDHPGGRKQHAFSTPLVGGVAMVMGAGAVVWLPTVALGMQTELIGFGLAVVLLIVIGILDDRFDVPWPVRVAVEVLAALSIAVIGGVKIEQIGPIFGLAPLRLGGLSLPFTVFATVGLINAMNMADGVDGLAGSLAFAAISMLTAAALYAGNLELALGLIVFLGAIAAFLMYNAPSPFRRRAAVFMGDSGSAVLGLVIAWSSFRLTQNPAHPVSPLLAPFLLAPAVVDCLVLIARRLAHKRSPFAADRNHLHHLMIDAGFTSGQIVTGVTLTSLALGATAALAFHAHAPKPAFAVVFVGIIGAYLTLTWNRGRAVGRLSRLRSKLLKTDFGSPASTRSEPEAHKAKLEPVVGNTSLRSLISEGGGRRPTDDPDFVLQRVVVEDPLSGAVRPRAGASGRSFGWLDHETVQTEGNSIEAPRADLRFDA